MIETVARALFDHEWKGQPGLQNEWRNSREYWIDAARVAVAAMDNRCHTFAGTTFETRAERAAREAPEPTSKLGADAPTSAIHSAGRPEPSKSANSFSDDLRRWNRECTGWEPSMSLLQRGADEAADLIDELCSAIEAMQSRDFTFQEADDKASAALAKARGETWKTCHIGSCHRHEECMYSPCRNASVDTRPEGGDATEIAAPFTSGAVPEGQTPNTPHRSTGE